MTALDHFVLNRETDRVTPWASVGARKKLICYCMIAVVTFCVYLNKCSANNIKQ